MLGCATTAPKVVTPVSEAHAPAPADTVLGMLDGQPLRIDGLAQDSRKRLQDLDGEYAQRRYQLLWTATEDMVGERLLAAEAKKRGMSLEALLQTEVESKVGAPSDAEIRGLYDANRELIKVPLATATSFLKGQWHAERVQALRRALIDNLRKSADVRYTLPPPALPHFDVNAGKSPTSGPANAPVTVVVFSDFQCPFSAQVRRLLHRLGELYPSTLRIVLRNFPLDQHQQARGAAEASLCAAEQDKFWPYYDMLFENAAALAPADLRRYAGQAELNVATFDACVASERPKLGVAADEEEAGRVGVHATPVLFVNGKRIVGVLPLPLMQAIIDRELAP